MTKLIKTPEEIARIRQSGKILAKILRRLKNESREGVKLIELEELTKKLLRKEGAKPAFLNFRARGFRQKYPFALCTSVNEILVHGRPSDYVLKSGDLLKLDLGVNWKKGFTDAAVTIPIGRVSKEGQRLIKLTRNALIEAIRVLKPGNTTGDIGFAIERVVNKWGAKIVEGLLIGHGVGVALHEEPDIYHFKPGSGMVLKEGMVLAIEPMTSPTSAKVVQMADDSFATSDGSISAHFEHTILITGKGAEILTE